MNEGLNQSVTLGVVKDVGGNDIMYVPLSLTANGRLQVSNGDFQFDPNGALYVTEYYTISSVEYTSALSLPAGVSLACALMPGDATSAALKHDAEERLKVNALGYGVVYDGLANPEGKISVFPVYPGNGGPSQAIPPNRLLVAKSSFIQFPGRWEEFAQIDGSIIETDVTGVNGVYYIDLAGDNWFKNDGNFQSCTILCRPAFNVVNFSYKIELVIPFASGSATTAIANAVAIANLGTFIASDSNRFFVTQIGPGLLTNIAIPPLFAFRVTLANAAAPETVFFNIALAR